MYNCTLFHQHNITLYIVEYQQKEAQHLYIIAFNLELNNKQQINNCKKKIRITNFSKSIFPLLNIKIATKLYWLKNSLIENVNLSLWELHIID